MSDDADRAAEYQELLNQKAAALRKPTPKPCGYCHNCGEQCRGSFCDGDCLSDFERRQR